MKRPLAFTWIHTFHPSELYKIPPDNTFLMTHKHHQEKTTKETAFSVVAEDLCVKRGILLRRISTRNSLENICVEVKKALQSANQYIGTDSSEDIETVHKKFYLMKSRSANNAV